MDMDQEKEAIKNIEKRNLGENNGISKNLSEIEFKTVELRVNGIKESIQRSRFVFVIMTIACSAILFTIWNSNFSRERTFAFERNPITAGKDKLTVQELGKRTLIEDWYKSRSIKIGLLGVQVDVADFSLIGSFALIVITIWYFYSQRQVNRAIIDLVGEKDTDKNRYNEEVRRFIYYGIIQNALFSKIIKSQSIAERIKETKEIEGEITEQSEERKNREKTEQQEPIELNNHQNLSEKLNIKSWILQILITLAFTLFLTLSPLAFLFLLMILLSPYAETKYVGIYLQTLIFTPILVYVVYIIYKFKEWTPSRELLKESDKAKWGLGLQKTDLKKEKSFSSTVVNFLEHLPFWTILAIIFRDILNLCMVSPIRGQTMPSIAVNLSNLSKYFNINGVPIGIDVISQFFIEGNIYPLIYVLLFDGFAVICAVYSKMLCDECIRFNDANIQTLNKFIESVIE